jgi:hypothetical protein
MKNIAYITGGVALGVAVFFSVKYFSNPNRKRRFNSVIRFKRK